MSRPLTSQKQRAEYRRRVKAWKPATVTMTFDQIGIKQTIAELIDLEDRNQTCEPFETTKVTTALLISEAARGKAQAIRADRKDVTS